MHLNILPVEIIKGISIPGNTVEIDFSSSNPAFEKLSADDTQAFEKYIEKVKTQHQAEIAIGGYLENRKWYSRSEIFKVNAEQFRNIHLGVDIWVNAGTEVFAPLEGVVHSFRDNKGKGNYGPTLILKHHINHQTFYTLYGHLNRQSLKGKKEGMFIRSGEKIGSIGNIAENGDWIPHLHFQVIIDIEEYVGDYPGVVDEKEIAFYQKNCPDPMQFIEVANKNQDHDNV